MHTRSAASSLRGTPTPPARRWCERPIPCTSSSAARRAARAAAASSAAASSPSASRSSSTSSSGGCHDGRGPARGFIEQDGHAQHGRAPAPGTERWVAVQTQHLQVDLYALVRHQRRLDKAVELERLEAWQSPVVEQQLRARRHAAERAEGERAVTAAVALERRMCQLSAHRMVGHVSERHEDGTPAAARWQLHHDTATLDDRVRPQESPPAEGGRRERAERCSTR
eukprot:2294950-Prymnesium_polylepis.1